MRAGSNAIVAVAQFKGGVGATTLAISIACCWARHGLRVALVDLDDVNPHLTAWACVGESFRESVGQALRRGKVTGSEVAELTFPVETFEGQLVVVPQPSPYHESFQFKADVLEGSASASEFVPALFESLKKNYDIIVIDLGGSWGMASFAALPLCDRILLVVDDDPVSINRSLENLQRLKRESDDEREFNFERWSIVMNGFTNRLMTPKELVSRVKKTKLFPSSSELFVVPFSEPGRDWGRPGYSFYDCADAKSKESIRRLASAVVAISNEPRTKSPKMLRRLRAAVSR